MFNCYIFLFSILDEKIWILSNSQKIKNLYFIMGLYWVMGIYIYILLLNKNMIEKGTISN